MSLETDTLILEALTKLAIARGAVPDGEQNDVYLDSLAPYDAGLIQRVCLAWRTKARQDYEPALPPVGTIVVAVEDLARKDAADASQRLLGPLPGKSYDEPTFYCPVCLDGFWETGWCPGRGHLAVDVGLKSERYLGQTTERCAKDNPHGPHGWARKCHCVESNPVIRQQRDRQAAFLAGKASAKGRAS